MLPRRSFLRTLSLGASSLPLWSISKAGPAANSRINHASFGASGMALIDIKAITRSPFINLVAVAEVDSNRLSALKEAFPDVRIYKDWRMLLDKEHHHLDSVNVSTPDHMHGPIGMTAMQLGLHVYGQKPLAHTLLETRQMTEIARENNIVTQMGTQLTSSTYERIAAKMIQDGVIGKIQEVHMFSHKNWGDATPRPQRADPVPANLDWDLWLGVAEQRSYIEDYYHPGNWRARLDFGTGTLGDMGCHIYSPMFQALGIRAPFSVQSTGNAPNKHNWAPDQAFEYHFTGNDLTAADSIKVTWTDGARRPPAELIQQFGDKMPHQGSIFIGTNGTLLQPHNALPIPYPLEKFQDYRYPKIEPRNHYLDFVNAVRGEPVKPLADFADYGGPLTETVLLGALASHFPNQSLQWDSRKLQFPDKQEANRYLSKTYRKGWQMEEFKV